jgi:2-(1,2-epoxy-1,2-dihydrophenyl)acetyl-CoA isomerase
VIAAVNGPAAGAGLSLALACDLRVASTRARFTVSFLRRGLAPDAGMTFLLQRAVGYSRALELCLSDAPIGARRAHRIGLVDRVARAERFPEEVAALADQVTSLPREVAAATKGLLLEAPALGLGAALDREAEVQARIAGREAHRAGVLSFFSERGVATGAPAPEPGGAGEAR